MDNYQIDGNKINQVLYDLIVTMVSEQRAMISFLIDDDLQKRDGSFEKTTQAFDDAKQFYRDQLLQSLYQNYASLKDILPPQVDPSE